MKEALEKDFKLEYISQNTLKSAFPFFGRLAVVQKKLKK